ncbi:hypothetical protein [Stenotrophomonas maltophilia]|uniref:hypothetical protein n=1 Tax=Stenotrophomonas maltophilia TaxID=40324 RepID=UPI00209BA275|nr:hypothetical protein [Stenotrophomonas maltophilia]MCO7494699.1 hypothetical protein [Stenotrophomonas maltophilia]
MEIENGEVLTLALLEHVDTGGDDSPGVIFDVTYEHDRVEFRTAGQKDAVAFGRGKLEHDRDWRDCRILFSQYHKTASIRGLTFDAPVKIASMTKAEFRDMQKTFQGPRGLKDPNDEAAMTEDRFPWDKHPVSAEAKAMVAKAEAHATLERLERKNPMRFRDYLIVAFGALGIIALPLLLLSLAFDLSGFLRSIF